MEHRLFGTGRGDLTQYSSSEQEPVGESRAVPGTLLGPEGPGVLLDSQRGRPSVEPLAFVFVTVVGRHRGGVGLRPYLENCTVDASIFVAKLIRAHGGCLGTRSRRRT